MRINYKRKKKFLGILIIFLFVLVGGATFGVIISNGVKADGDQPVELVWEKSGPLYSDIYNFTKATDGYLISGSITSYPRTMGRVSKVDTDGVEEWSIGTASGGNYENMRVSYFYDAVDLGNETYVAVGKVKKEGSSGVDVGVVSKIEEVEGTMKESGYFILEKNQADTFYGTRLNSILVDDDGGLIISGSYTKDNDSVAFVMKINSSFDCTITRADGEVCPEDLVWYQEVPAIGGSIRQTSINTKIKKANNSGEFFILTGYYAGSSDYYGKRPLIAKITESDTLDSATVSSDDYYFNLGWNDYYYDFITFDERHFVLRGQYYPEIFTREFNLPESSKFFASGTIGRVDVINDSKDREYLIAGSSSATNFLRKYDDNGTILWGSPSDVTLSSVRGIVVDDDGSIILIAMDSGNNSKLYKFRDNTFYYHVNYHIVDGENIPDNLSLHRDSALAGELFSFTNYDTYNGYKLDGWYTDPGLTTKFEDYNAPATHEIDLYGKYVPAFNVDLNYSNWCTDDFPQGGAYTANVKVPQGQSGKEYYLDAMPYDRQTITPDKRCFLKWSATYEHREQHGSSTSYTYRTKDFDPDTLIEHDIPGGGYDEEGNMLYRIYASWTENYLIVKQNGDIFYANGDAYDWRTSNDGISWDAENDVLTLTDYSFLPIKIENGGEAVDIVLHGDNVFSTDMPLPNLGKETPNFAIYSYGQGTVTVKGDGTLKMVGSELNDDSPWYWDTIIMADDLVFGENGQTEDSNGPKIVGAIRAIRLTINSGKIAGDVQVDDEVVVNGGEAFFGYFRVRDTEGSPSVTINGGELNLYLLILEDDDDAIASILVNDGILNALMIACGDDDNLNSNIKIINGKINTAGMVAPKIVMDGNGELNINENGIEIVRNKFANTDMLDTFVNKQDFLEDALGEEVDCMGIQAKTNFTMNDGVANVCGISGGYGVTLNDGNLNVNGMIMAMIAFNQNGGNLNIESHASDYYPGIGIYSGFSKFTGGTANIYADLAGVVNSSDMGYMGDIIDLKESDPDFGAEIEAMEGYAGAKLPDRGVIEFSGTDIDITISVGETGMTPVAVTAQGEDGDPISLIYEELPDDWAIKIGDGLVVVDDHLADDKKEVVVGNFKKEDEEEGEKSYFVGSYFSYKGIEPTVDFDGMVFENVPKYVHIHGDAYTISFDDGTGVSDKTDYHYGDPVEKPTEPTKETTPKYQYEFIGWSDGETTYGPNDELPPATSNITYTAVFDKREYTPASEWLKNQEYTIDEVDQAVFRVDIANKFFNYKVTVDGTVITEGVDYDITEGSTIVTLKQAYLDGLTEGEHTMDVYFDEPTEDEDVVIATTFTAKKNNTPDTPDIPDTGEDGEEQANTNEKSGDHGFNTVDHSAVTVTIMLAVTISSAFFVSRRVMRRK